MNAILTSRLKLILPLIGITILIDQLSKIWAVSYLEFGPRFSFLFDTIRIAYAENHGAFLGLGNGLPPELRFWIFTALVGLFLAALFVYLLMGKNIDQVSLISLALVFSGGFSNFIDRAMNNGGVVDFLNMGIGSLRTGIFNIADVYIMVGAGLMIIGPYLFKEDQKKP